MSGLRIIGGKARGRRIKAVPGDSTRPITDRTKESLFNIIGQDIENASFLDLFAGTGSVGIEALSRGAKFARFIDILRPAVEIIKANLETTGLKEGAQVLQADSLHYLRKPADRPFDYLYIAPPQYKAIWKKALVLLDQHPGWFSSDSWIIVQIHPVEYEALQLDHLTLFDQRKYGSTLLLFYEATQ
jgi:16S rRNA (guanine(966)-N(2))-methyltransferase RsmD